MKNYKRVNNNNNNNNNNNEGDIDNNFRLKPEILTISLLKSLGYLKYPGNLRRLAVTQISVKTPKLKKKYA